MDNIHAPTIPSGKDSGAGTNGLALTGLSLAQLQDKKVAIESEMQALSEVLVSQGVKMSTPLIDAEGFPRADLDVAQIRTARTRLIYLNNDYKTIMNVIEKVVHDHFANNVPVPERSTTATSVAAQKTIRDSVSAGQEDLPFASVRSVVADSPAAMAGLQIGDLIRQFGTVNRFNHANLVAVAECARLNEGKKIVVKIQRPFAGEHAQDLQLTLVPNKDWGGRGLLGCHIVPYDRVS